MAEPEPQRGPRVVRIPVARPLVSAVAMMAFGAALLVGGGTQNPSAVASGPTLPPASALDAADGLGDTSVDAVPPDWDVTPRDLVVGTRTANVLLALDQGVATPFRVATLAAALQPLVPDPGPGRPVGATSVPEVLWSAYRSAVASAPSSCRLPVQLLAAIGQVESGSLAGRGLDSRHRAVPAVLGPVLNGGGFAAIRDTDGGRYDGDPTWDRAVGPMQFIPSTWQRWGRDANGDGSRDPQNVEDAASSAAAYLCAGDRDLSTATGLRSAILSYNHSEAYLADVLRIMRTVTPGGPSPRSVVTVPDGQPPMTGRPVVGPPSRPPVRAIARPPASTPSSSRPSAPTTTSSPSGPSTATGTTTPGTTTSGTPTTSTTTNSTVTSTTASGSATSTTSTSTTTSPLPTTTSTTTSTTTITTTSTTTTTSGTSTTSTPPMTTTAPSTTSSTTSTTGSASPTTSPTTCPDPTTSTVDPSSTTPPTTDPSTSPTTVADPCASATPTATTGADPVVATTTSIEGPTAG